MTTNKTPITLFFLPFTLFAAPVEIASFGGDYVSANQSSQATLQDLSGVPTASDSIRQIGGFGVTNNPTIGTNYIGPTFTGGAQAVKIGVDAANGLVNADVYNDASGDYVRLFAQTPSGVSAGSSLNYIFSMDVADTVYSNITSFSGRTAGGVSGSLVSRFMLETDGGDIYLSNTSISGGFGGSTWSISNLSTEQWALLTPGADDWRGDFGSLTFNTALSSETISSVGWFASMPVSSDTNATLTIRDFEVMAIPEPGSLALVAVALGSLLLFRRKRG